MDGHNESHLNKFMADFGFPEEAISEVLSAYGKTFAHPEYAKSLSEIRRSYETDRTADLSPAIALTKKAATETGVSEYTLNLIVLILLSEASVAHYAEEGVSEKIWKANFTDLKYKTEECRLVKGVYGVFCPEWYARFFAVTRFSFGKLQFEADWFCRTYEKNGVTVLPKDIAINVHIPRTGEKLTPKDVDDACREASGFFKERLNLKKVVFVCDSWLLYPENRKMLSPGSNLLSFIDRFDVTETHESKDYGEVWRLFDREYDGDVDHLPQDTSLRREYAKRIRDREPLGRGFGIWIYEA